MKPDEFTLEEYKYILSELTRYKDVIRKLELFSVSGIAAIYAWLATKSGISPVAWLIPCLLSLFGAYRSFTLSKSIKRQYQYLHKIEQELKSVKDNHLGWFQYRHNSQGAGMTTSRIVFWALLIVVTIVAPLFIRSTN